MSTPVGSIPVSPIGSLPGTTPPTTPTTGNNSLGEDAFLKLLIAQLKYQDPMKPEDSSQFMAQTAQFNSLSKLTEIDSSMSALLGTQGFLQAATLVGRTATYTDATGKDVTGLVASASFGPKGPTLHIGDTDVPIADVTGISTGATGTTGTTGATG
jgi:flagellar basal-body rod modification protein FlgD